MDLKTFPYVLLSFIVILALTTAGVTQTVYQSPALPNGVYLAGVNTSAIAKGMIGLNSSNKVLLDPDSIGTTVNSTLTVTGAATLTGGIAGTVNITTSNTLSSMPKVTFTGGDFTTSGVGTNLEQITGLSYSLPATALNISFHCAGSYLQNVAAAAITLGVQVTAAPTTSDIQAVIYTAAGTPAAGMTSVTSATSVGVVTGTPSAAGVTLPWTMDGLIENPISNASTFTINVKTATASDTVTIKRDSYCSLNF